MAWTNEETNKFQLDNTEFLRQVNETLNPDQKPTTGKIGIFCPGQNGDLMTAMSILKYRNELWSDKEIIWYCNMPNADALKFSPVNEVRPWPWAGNGLPIGTPDFYPLLCLENNRLNKGLAKQYELTADLDDGYFPAPHQLTVDQRHGIDYPNCSRKVFGIDPKAEWHPYIKFSKMEEYNAFSYWQSLPHPRTIMMETICGSGQSIWNEEMTKQTQSICSEILGECNFIMACELKQFTVRQVALLNNYCDLFIGISSGISVSTSGWGLKPIPKIQFCGSHTCSTVTLSNGPIDLITHDEKHPEFAKMEFYDKLKQILKTL